MSPGDLFTRYTARVQDGRLEADPAQRQIAQRLDTLAQAIAQQRLARKTNALGWLFSRKAPPQQALRGLYIHGAVGRGKTMLMDLFFESIPVQRKRRAHFHDFMADVHERIHTFRLAQGRHAGDPIQPVAAALAEEAWVLCFDEFSVTDIADAMILGRLFDALFARGVVMVATSNVAPDDLYAGGLNRTLFLPFIERLKERMQVLRLEARTDYRMEKLAGADVYHVPVDAAGNDALDAAFARLTAGAAHAAELAVRGRVLKVPCAGAGTARFSFAQLCGAALGASDYLALARRYHTLVVDGIPVLKPTERNEAKRLIMLVDILYEHHVKLLCTAAAEPEGLYVGAEGTEAFEFARTVSRLTEMRSAEYLALPHGRLDSRAGGQTTGLVET